MKIFEIASVLCVYTHHVERILLYYVCWLYIDIKSVNIIILLNIVPTFRLLISFKQSRTVLWSLTTSRRCTIFRAMCSLLGSTSALYTVLNVPFPSTRSKTTRRHDCRSSPLMVIEKKKKIEMTHNRNANR